MHPSPSFPHLSKPKVATCSDTPLTLDRQKSGIWLPEHSFVLGLLIAPLPIYSSYRNAAIFAADSAPAVVTLAGFTEEGSSSTSHEFGGAMSEAQAEQATRTVRVAGSEMRRGRRRFGGGGGEPVWRGVLSFVAAMRTIALAESSLFGAAGKRRSATVWGITL